MHPHVPLHLCCLGTCAHAARRLTRYIPRPGGQEPACPHGQVLAVTTPNAQHDHTRLAQHTADALERAETGSRTARGTHSLLQQWSRLWQPRSHPPTALQREPSQDAAQATRAGAVGRARRARTASSCRTRRPRWARLGCTRATVCPAASSPPAPAAPGRPPAPAAAGPRSAGCAAPAAPPGTRPPSAPPGRRPARAASAQTASAPCARDGGAWAHAWRAGPMCQPRLAGGSVLRHPQAQAS